MYQELGTVIYLAMSADATCRGIRSPRDGPLVMELTKGMVPLLFQALMAKHVSLLLNIYCLIFLNRRFWMATAVMSVSGMAQPAHMAGSGKQSSVHTRSIRNDRCRDIPTLCSLSTKRQICYQMF